ncbi:glycosyl hydrolase family 18 protein [Geothrix sp. PMB-07]|uniref:glycosyl hydrolase family 18 protein n=1 Tax=Geothrix sp. PMB-07 TaxID=3068640 RepID=UPI00274053BA|nr:glycosyl hydrolase family 18 protein [Geothrix sp. PMB-07]WLT31244.1 glycosyl hydrolase family 18 protein [Geothrix sp. PMB-07]
MKLLLRLACCLFAASLLAAEVPLVLTNHLGYERYGAKHAVVRAGAGETFDRYEIRTWPADRVVFKGDIGVGTPVDRWRDWTFWPLDFTDLQLEGDYVLVAYHGDRAIRSLPFKVQAQVLERHTLSNVLAYFKGQRSSGLLDKADRNVMVKETGQRMDARGGWFDATGDYGKHFSQLSSATYFNTQQIPLVVYSLLRSHDLLAARQDVNHAQIRRRLVDEALFGADYLVRIRDPKGSFHQTVMSPGPGKKPEDRQIAQYDKTVGSQVGYRGGAGMAIAALAMAARLPQGGDFDPATYRKTAEAAFDYLEAHNTELLNDHKENLLDDMTALTAATELARTTSNPRHLAAAAARAERLMARLLPDGSWRADDKDRPFFHPSDAGLPVVALLAFHDLAPKALQPRLLEVVRKSLQYELTVTGEVANPFGLARQKVQNKAGERRTAFFFPHDTETAPWWQGENARLGSLAAAARLAAPLFAEESPFLVKLRSYAVDQLNWILGLNPFDASMLHGTGHNNPEYGWLGTWQYQNVPGGIVNGICSGLTDEHDISFNVPYSVTGKDDDWRWGEQWLPHGAWYLLAVAAGDHAMPSPAPKTVIAYVFPQDRRLGPQEVDPTRLTHINYAFADIKNGRMVEGFKHDTENYRVLNGLKAKNPALKVLVSVGGWTWSGGFSDASLTAESRKVFVESAMAYVDRHDLDGLDVDWEYPGLPGYGNVNRPEDKHNATLLMADLRAGLDRLGERKGRRLLLTIAAGAMDSFLANTEMDQMSRHLDYVNLMTYDQYEAEADATTGHHAPLFTNPANPKGYAASTIVDHFVAAGVPERKLVLGVPFYGKPWGGVRNKAHGLYQPGGAAKLNLFTSFTNLKDKLENKDGFQRFWDDLAQAPYLYNPAKGLWITYEDEESLGAKCRYIVDRGLGGVMFWEYHGDDGRLLEVIRKGFAPKAAPSH